MGWWFAWSLNPLICSNNGSRKLIQLLVYSYDNRFKTYFENVSQKKKTSNKSHDIVGVSLSSKLPKLFDFIKT